MKRLIDLHMKFKEYSRRMGLDSFKYEQIELIQMKSLCFVGSNKICSK